MKTVSASDLVVDDLAPLQRSLRVAMVTETYPPEVNGVATTVARMAEGLRARHHAIQLVRLRQNPDDDAGRAERYEEVLLHGMQIPRYPHLKMGVPCTRALVALWTRARPDVVHIATEGPLGWSALRAARKLKLPVVSEFRTNFHAYSRHYGVGWLRKPIVAYLRKFHNQTLRTMVPTEALRRELQRMGFENLAVVARGVDTTLFSPSWRSEVLRARWGASPQTCVMLCVGRLAPEKNLSVLREAYRAAQVSGRQLKMVLVGDGPDRAALEQAWPDVHFAGVQRGEELAAHYASADLFVFPSLTETFGNVVMEAMASGLPLVAFDYAAAAEMVHHGHNGLLAPLGDAARFVSLVCEASADASRCRSMGDAARQTAMAQDWGRVVADLEAVLLDALAEGQAQVKPLGFSPFRSA
ncbi:glycosyltransferase family 4 protein [Methyloversatilis thermotolerans]|uniref:glycosyltransferase family 4 protein n=1 Tax=Methyloversatilis thermotolerans TaxID=1346290 RepID=UPI0003703CE3|nr:glycosyltransferase family 1 protein [Methyloversatilis thermotolerans]